LDENTSLTNRKDLISFSVLFRDLEYQIINLTTKSIFLLTWVSGLNCAHLD
jgi:hypothetical protein